MDGPDAVGWRIEATVCPWSLLGDLVLALGLVEPSPLEEPVTGPAFIVSKVAFDVDLDFVYNPGSPSGDDDFLGFILPGEFDVLFSVGASWANEGVGQISTGPIGFWGLHSNEELEGLNLEFGATGATPAFGGEGALAWSPSLDGDVGGPVMGYLGMAVGSQVSGYAEVGYTWNISRPLHRALSVLSGQGDELYQ